MRAGFARPHPRPVAGVEPSEGFLATAEENLAGRAARHKGSATALPLADASVDVVTSGLVLNFAFDPPAAVLEIARVTRRGGAIAACVWNCAVLTTAHHNGQEGEGDGPRDQR